MENKTSTLEKVVSKISKLTSNRLEDIVDAIKQDHNDLKRMIVVMKDEKIPDSEKKVTLENFTSLLKSHASSEEKALYEHCCGIKDLVLKTEEGYVEHDVADKLLKTITDQEKSIHWRAQVQVLAELVEHHIKEEESDLLPKISKHFEKEQTEKFGREFISLREKSQINVTQENAGVLGKTDIHLQSGAM